MMRALFGRKRAGAPYPDLEPKVPAGQRIYAVGDIHGRADLLDRMAELIAADLSDSADRDATTIFLGDYVDRGPSAAHVLGRLAAADFPTPIVALLGNHEQTMIDFLDDENVLELWRTFGGLQTLMSYGVPPELLMSLDLSATREAFAERLPDQHRQFLAGLRTHHVVGDYFFCHAGVRPGIPLGRQTRDDLIWIREPFLSSTTFFGKVVVHGHTPSQTTVVRRNRIGIDTGAFATDRLTCLRLDGTDVRFIEAQT